MSFGGSSSGGNYPAPVIAGLFQGETQAFQPVPYPNTANAANNAYYGMALDTSPSPYINQYGYDPSSTVQQGSNLAGMGSTLGGQAQNYLTQYDPQSQYAFDTGVNASNTLMNQYAYPVQSGQNVYNYLLGQSGAPVNIGNQVYGAMRSQYGQPIQAGQNIYNEAQALAPQAAAGGQNIYNTLTGQMGAPIAAGQAQYGMLSPYVTPALMAGFDPQNALYNQQFALQQQQNASAMAQAGVGQSPYAAGLEAQGNTNFNIDWQQSQLQREQTAAQTAALLSGTAMQDLTSGYDTAANMANVASGALQAGYGTAGNIYGMGAQALNQGYQTGADMLGLGANAAMQGYGAQANMINNAMADLSTGYGTGLNNLMGGMSALNTGLSQFGNLQALDLSGAEGLLQAGGGAAYQGNQLGQSAGEYAQGLTNQQAAIQAQKNAQYLAYLQASGLNAANYFGSATNALNAGTNLYGTTNQAQAANNAAAASALGGLGSLAGTLGGATILGNAIGGGGAGLSSTIADAGLGAALL